MRKLGWISTLVFAACSGEGSTMTATPPDSGVPIVNDASTAADAMALDAEEACDPEIPLSAPAVSPAAPYTFEHAELRGPYAVGTHIAHYFDAARGNREVVVQFFYPTDVRDGPPAPLMEPEVAADFTAAGWPADFNERILTRSTFDVAISSSNARWPVVLYSHGLTSYRWDNQSTCEQLASEGFIVVAISHPGSSTAVVLSDGTVARSTLPPLPTASSTAEEVFDSFAYFDTLMLDTWLPDARFVIDELERENTTCSWIFDRLDLARLGIFGLSFGGATAFQLCAADARCDAALDLDGGLFGAPPRPVDRPLMFVKSGYASDMWDRLHALAESDAYTVRIDGTTHANFSYFGTLGNAFFPGTDRTRLGYGPILQQRAVDIYTDYVVSFMRGHVLALDAPLLDGPPPYPEVVFEHTNGGSANAPISIMADLYLSAAFGAPPPARGMTMTVVGTSSSTIADANGHLQLDGVVETGTFAVELTHPDAYPTVSTFTNRGRMIELPPMLNDRRAGVERTASQAGVVLDPTKGIIAVNTALGFRGSTQYPAHGVRVSSSSGEGPYYFGDDGFIELGRTTTSSRGFGVFFNAEPGTVTLSFEHDTLTCFERLAAPPEVTGSTPVIVLADHASSNLIVCE